MAAHSWTLLLRKDETTSAIEATLLEETEDGLDLDKVARVEFGPFDTAQDVLVWAVREWAPRARLPLR